MEGALHGLEVVCRWRVSRSRQGCSCLGGQAVGEVAIPEEWVCWTCRYAPHLVLNTLDHITSSCVAAACLHVHSKAAECLSPTSTLAPRIFSVSSLPV